MTPCVHDCDAVKLTASIPLQAAPSSRPAVGIRIAHGNDTGKVPVGVGIEYPAAHEHKQLQFWRCYISTHQQEHDTTAGKASSHSHCTPQRHYTYTIHLQ
jgi:hypothetical protein